MDATLALVVALVAALRSITRPRLELAAEVSALRHRLAVLRQRAPRRLRRPLRRYIAYHHRWRPHLSLDKDAPIPRATQPPGEGRCPGFCLSG